MSLTQTFLSSVNNCIILSKSLLRVITVLIYFSCAVCSLTSANGTNSFQSDSGLSLKDAFAIKNHVHMSVAPSTEERYSYPIVSPIPDVTPACRKILTSFAESAANFTLCTLLNARPVTICQSCISNYYEMSAIYSNLTDNGKNSDCKAELLNCDRLMVLQINYQFLDSTWEQAKCPKCLTKPDNASEIPHLTDEAKFFFKELTKVVQCLNETQSDSNVTTPRNNLIESLEKVAGVCEKCKESYMNLNEFYDKMNTEYNNQICLDIVDAMNITRHIWNTKYNCIQFFFNGLPVLILSGAVALLPIIFYLAVRFGTNARESALVQQKRMSFVQSSHSNSMQSINR